MSRLLLFAFSFFLLSCNDSAHSKDQASNPNTQQKTETFPVKELIIGNGEEEGWGGDIRLSIISVTETDSAKLFTAISNYEGKKVGLLIGVPKKVKEGGGFGSGIVLKSIGPESDNLLVTLAKLYKQKTDTTIKFTDSISVTFVNLAEFAKSLGAKEGTQYETENQYKLFYEGTKDGDYAELYLNINPTEHWIELAEKDEEYRAAIIKFLKR